MLCLQQFSGGVCYGSSGFKFSTKVMGINTVSETCHKVKSDEMCFEFLPKVLSYQKLVGFSSSFSAQMNNLLSCDISRLPLRLCSATAAGSNLQTIKPSLEDLPIDVSSGNICHDLLV